MNREVAVSILPSAHSEKLKHPGCGSGRKRNFILDGDTIEVLHNNREERIRLNGIDCPERGQTYGQKAKQATSELIFGKEMTLHTFGRNKYGCTIADTPVGNMKGFWRGPIPPSTGPGSG